MNKKEDKQNKSNDKSINREQELLNKIKLLETTITKKDEEIKSSHENITNLLKKNDELNSTINKINQDFIIKVNEKANEANKILQAKIKETQDKSEKELSNLKKYALSDSIIGLLQILNQFSLATNHKVEDPKLIKFYDGFKIFNTLFNNWLKEIGVIKINVKVGDEFDPNIMDAVDIFKDSNLENNKVYKIIEDGYKLHERVIYHAKVIVVKK